MRAWRCVNCGKQEQTKFFRPKWVGYNREHWVWRKQVYDEMNPWDFGNDIYCGKVILAKERYFEGV